MFNKKNFNKLLILVLILISVFSAGCTSDSSNSDNYGTNDDSNYNASSNTLNDLNNGSENLNNSDKPPHYEKKGYCDYVVDGDTIDVVGVGRIRFSGVNTPERGQAGYQEAKDFVKSYCLGKTVYLDIDDAKNYDKYGRTLAVVYTGKTNLNALLLKKGYAEIMYIPPSEFNPYSWT